MITEEKICPKCLLKDLAIPNKDEYFRSIFDYIESIPTEMKTPQDEYEKRLTACQNCDKLINGMCKLCGCFIEVRGAKKINKCPDSNNKWLFDN